MRYGNSLAVAKSQPTLSDVHVSVPLSNMSVAYMMDRTREFFAHRLAPVLPSQFAQGAYYVYPRGDWFRLAATERPPGTESAGSGFNVVTAYYNATVKALHKDVADQIRANQDAAIDLDRDAANFVTQGILLKRDYDFVTKFFQSGIWTRSVDVTQPGYGGLWSTGGSTPIKDLRAEIDLAKVTTTKKFNKLAIGGKVWAKLQDNADFISRINFGSPGNPVIVTLELLAQVLGLEEVVVMDTVYNVADEGQPDSFQYMAGNHALLMYVDQNPGLLTASAAYTFAWTGLFGASADGEGLRTSKFRMEHIKSDRVEGEMGYDMKVVAQDLGVFFPNVIA